MDNIIRAISADGFVSIAAVSSRGLTERAREIHNASPVAAAAIGRVMAATSILGSAIKKDGASVTVRIHGGGPLGSIIAVSDCDGNVRCCAGNPEVELPLRTDGKLDVGRAVGTNGMLTVIRDDGENEPYTGGVALVSGEIAEDFTSYFHTSEQVPTAVALGVLVDRDRTVRAAGGYVVSLLPGAPENLIDAVEQNVAETGAVTNILDGGGAEDLINSVMRGLEPRILSTESVEYRCYCSRERVAGALAGIGREEVDDILKKGETVEVTCRFCDEIYNFSPEEIKNLNLEVDNGQMV
ncbi:MAG: Hsp33 family molecular chaperone HslO [Oscillospiraceae bacterium]|jgi:molecular chaperone Hsp33|nr:Hsp33 family molecular chaperone HslO [Oscillospiraceae bacterium]